MIGNQKGGIGKSLITTLLSTSLSQKPFNKKVLVIDLDNQKSIANARAYDLQAYDTESEPFKILIYDIKELQNNIHLLDIEFDFIFLDVAGKLDNNISVESQEITKALMYVDCLFIPFVSGAFNLDSTLDYYKHIKAVQTQRSLQSRKIKVFGFINMYRHRSKANQFLTDNIQALQAKENIKMMHNFLNDYALFREGDTITSLYDAQSTDTAKQNFTAFFNEFLQLVTEG